MFLYLEVRIVSVMVDGDKLTKLTKRLAEFSELRLFKETSRIGTQEYELP